MQPKPSHRTRGQTSQDKYVLVAGNNQKEKAEETRNGETSKQRKLNQETKIEVNQESPNNHESLENAVAKKRRLSPENDGSMVNPMDICCYTFVNGCAAQNRCSEVLWPMIILKLRSELLDPGFQDFCTRGVGQLQLCH